MRVKNKNYSSIWLENKTIKIIDQTKLPYEFSIIELESLEDFCRAIEHMQVRGAPLIGVTAALGLAKSIYKNPKDSNIFKSYEKLLKTRPTAVNLKWAIEKIKNQSLKYNINERGDIAIKLAIKIMKDDVESCKRIGANGLEIIKKIYSKKRKTINILTHCNAGWLATVDYGTALSPIFFAKKAKIPIHVWVDETRPRNQGGLLTSWELKNQKIAHTVVVDNAGGYLMQHRKIDLCIVGSDRTTLSGDVCNKIGTYLKAISAYDNNIPFYVALPTSTIDKKIKFGKDVPIEIRNGKEISELYFQNSNGLHKGKIYGKEIKTYNPAFDITPSKYITKLITDKGICKADNSSIKKLLKK